MHIFLHFQHSSCPNQLSVNDPPLASMPMLKSQPCRPSILPTQSRKSSTIATMDYWCPGNARGHMYAGKAKRTKIPLCWYWMRNNRQRRYSFYLHKLLSPRIDFQLTCEDCFKQIDCQAPDKLHIEPTCGNSARGEPCAK